MGRTRVLFYRDEAGNAPAYEGLQDLLRQGRRKEFAKCRARIGRLEEMGFELRRPEADYLRDGIYELRATRRRTHYRILYFFQGQVAVVLSHLIMKEGAVPDSEIDRAILHKSKFEIDPDAHTFAIQE